MDCASRVMKEAIGFYDTFQFSRALESVWSLIGELDKYLVESAPWNVAKNPDSRDQLGMILNTAYEGLRVAVCLAHPVMPHVTQTIWEQMGQNGRLGQQEMDNFGWGQTSPGLPIGTPAAVFPRVQKEEALERMEQMEEQIRAEGAPKPGEPAKPGSAAPSAPAAGLPAVAGDGKISIDDFMKVELRVGEIKSAERIAGADKILKLMVDIGTEVRQIVAGIAQFYEPEKLVGRRVIVVVNLAPRKLRGVESNGMVVAATVGPEGRPVLAGFHEDAPVGSRLK